jgi:hypothetical protein
LHEDLEFVVADMVAGHEAIVNDRAGALAPA